MNRPAENTTDGVLGVLPETPPAVRQRPRDPFKWVLVAMGVTFLVGVPAGIGALGLENRMILRVVLGLLVLSMALIVLTSLAIGLRVSIQKRILQFTLRDLFFLTTIASLGCLMAVTSDGLAQASISVLLFLLLLAWSTGGRGTNSLIEYGERILVNAMALAVALVFAFQVTAFVMIFVTGIGR
jgi:hypothetical protein